ncbi:CRISPR-associated RAMP Cmr1 [Methanosarcina barkeri 3]|uniref:CRISPR-associated RAMP Cmr1 n=1 Tax=Methanosarcina barkeri 3 TaxID=1434107 RepID=A0A0E3SHL0_METBA|nr:type III-B CRISPR module RAMP protein Cmr1 [Methanosarcina barkeri]AKB80721.1 CRISPR-associated RAMP Cmr1 [Methanosarcina barkeri 3]
MIKTEIKFKTLTPIWTGDADRKCTTIKETSIIGSMRWWYEAIIRGMGGYACDPSNGGCEFNTVGYERARKNGKSVDESLEIGLKNVCPVCRLFGCTGWKRRFRIEVEGKPPVKLVFEEKIKVFDAEFWIKKTYSNSMAFYSNEYFKFYLITEENEEIKNKLLFLLNFMEKVGSIGSKSQNGFGLVKFDELDPRFDLKNLKNQVYKFNETNQDKLRISKKLSHLRNIQDLYYFDVEIEPTDVLEEFVGLEHYDKNLLLTGFILRYFLRKEFKSLKKFEINSLVLNASDLNHQQSRRYNREKYHTRKKYKNTSKIVTRALFGSDLKNKWASLVEISHLYRVNDAYNFRVLCNLPPVITYDEISIRFNKKEVIKKIQSVLKNNFSVKIEGDLSEENIDIKDLSVLNNFNFLGDNVYGN